MSGDEYATQVSDQGSNTSWMREIAAHVLDQLCESAIQRLELTEETGGSKPPVGNLSYADFSGGPCTMG